MGDYENTELEIVQKYFALLWNQFSLAAWALRIVPDVNYRFVNFSSRSAELGADVPVDIQKYLFESIGIEIFSNKFGTLHIFGPASYHTRLQEKSWIVEGPSIRLEGTDFDEVVYLLSQLEDIFQDKHFGEIRKMLHSGYVQDRYVLTDDARLLESLSVVLEAWYITIQEDVFENQLVNVTKNVAHLSANDYELFAKLYLPNSEGDLFGEQSVCIAIGTIFPYVQWGKRGSIPDNRETIFMSNMLKAMQNPNRP